VEPLVNVAMIPRCRVHWVVGYLLVLAAAILGTVLVQHALRRPVTPLTNTNVVTSWQRRHGNSWLYLSAADTITAVDVDGIDYQVLKTKNGKARQRHHRVSVCM
jgi:hypothetical protein